MATIKTPASLGSPVLGRPSIVRSGDGWLAAFARGLDHTLWWSAQTLPDGGWLPWAQISSGVMCATDPVAAVNQDGRLEVFAGLPDNSVWHTWEIGRGKGWVHGESLGGSGVGRAAVANNADGRLEVFMRGTDSAMHHIWQVKPNGNWSEWVVDSNISLATSLSVAGDGGGLLHLAGVAANGHIGLLTQVEKNSGWGEWVTYSVSAQGTPAIGVNSDGRVEVIWRGWNNISSHIWQRGDGWGGPEMFGGQILDEPTSILNSDGALQVFSRGGPDSGLWTTLQIGKSAGGN